MAGPFRIRTDEDRDARIAAEWPGPMSLRRIVVLVTWWLMCIILPPLAILASAIYASIEGCAGGARKGLQESRRALLKWWSMFENGDGR